MARVVLLIVSLIGALTLAECGARLLGLSKTWASYGAEAELNLKDLVTSEPVGFTRPPGATWKMPRGLTFRANAEGFRDHPFALAAPPDVIRVAFVGDSVTEGYGVEEAARFSNLAIARMNRTGTVRYEELNFGVVGQSTADEYLVLTRHALKFKPSVVLLQVGWNDFAQNLRKLPVVKGAMPPSGVQAFSAPSLAGGGWKRFFPEHSALYRAVAERVSVLQLKRGGPNAILDLIGATAPEEWKATEAILQMFVDAGRAAGAAPMIAYFPMDVEVLTADEVKAQRTGQRLAGIAEHLDVPSVDLLGPLRRNGDRTLYFDDVHLTETGHLIVSDELARAIDRVMTSATR